MDIQELKDTLKQGESNSVEFKERISSDINLAILISSFANSFGGKIIIGVSNKGKIRGISNPENLIARIKKVALTNIKPQLNLTIKEMGIYNKKIIVVEIIPNDSAPHAVQGIYYHRKGRYSGVIEPETLEKEIIERAQHSRNSEESLKNQLHQLITQNAELYKRFKEENSWKSKAVDYIVGAFIGAVVSKFIF